MASHDCMVCGTEEPCQCPQDPLLEQVQRELRRLNIELLALRRRDAEKDATIAQLRQALAAAEIEVGADAGRAALKVELAAAGAEIERLRSDLRMSRDDAETALSCARVFAESAAPRAGSTELRSEDEWVNEALGWADLSPSEEGWNAKDALEEIGQAIKDANGEEPRDTLLSVLALKRLVRPHAEGYPDPKIVQNKSCTSN